MTVLKKIVVACGILGMADTAFILAIDGGDHIGVMLPGAVGLVLTAWAVWTRHHPFKVPALQGHPMTACILILFGFGLASFLVVQSFILYYAIPGETIETDWCVVLGAGVRKEEPTKTLQRRIDATAAYLKRYDAVRVIVSGGLGAKGTISEAEAMERGLVEAGIDRARIILEPSASSTWENLRYALALIEAEDPAADKSGEKLRVAVVTSNFHFFRVQLLAARLDMTVCPVVASTPWYLLPNACLREYFAVVKSWVIDR